MRAILLVITALVFFSLSDAASKALTETVPAMQVTWLRFVVFVAVMLPMGLLLEGRGVLRSKRPMLQILRGLGVLGSALLFIAGLRFLPMAEATAMAFVSPIFVTALSIPFLGESVGIRRWAAVVVGLIGVLIVVRPGTDAFDPAAFFPIFSALSWAVALVVTRKMSGTDGPLTALIYSALVGFIAASLALPFVWEPLDGREILLGLATGLTSTVAQALIVQAYRYATASVLAPFFYSQLIASAALGYFIFSAVPDFWTWVGASVIVASGLYTAHRERLRARRTRPPATAVAQR